MSRHLTRLCLAATLLASLAACGDDDAPTGPPFDCGGMQCQGDQACVHEFDDVMTRDDYVCRPDLGCVDVPGTDYCPGATGVNCFTPEEPLDPMMPDGGVRAVTRVECRYPPS